MPKHIKLMILQDCPHCKKALSLIDELCEKHKEFKEIQIEVIDEVKEEEKTRGYDYWYVPTFFVNDVKQHEGIVTKEKIEEVLQAAL